jgi:RNA polymerase sigma factor (sigma-70 family)
MSQRTDHELLAEFARTESEDAFAQLVTRYVHLVYSTALRSTGNAHHAEEITQAVFIILTRKAAALPSRVVLSGWLYQTTRFTAANFLKAEIRRQQREQEAYMQSTLNDPGSQTWQQIAPMLEDAMGRLGETDRNAVVLRFFENTTAAEAAAILNLTEAATHKRTSRALDKLRKIFTKHGVNSTTSIIAGAISAHSIQNAPALLAKSTATAALAKGVSVSTLTLVKGTLNLMAWAKAKFAIITGLTLATTAGLAVVAVQEIQASGRTRKTPTFAAEGYLSSVMYRFQSDTNQFVKETGKVSFLYSNNIWRIQYTYDDFTNSEKFAGISADKIIGETLDEKKIPDGTREIIVFSPTMSTDPKVMNLAMVRSHRFPEWGLHGLFVPWLSLCPNPELPVTVSNRIHFEFQPELYGDPKNEAGFVAKYIGPDKEFLSELIVTNNGTVFMADGTTRPYPEPYNNGFVAFSYKVLEVTNCHGVTFPLKAVFTQFIPMQNGKASDDLYAIVTTEFTIQNIDIGARRTTFVPVPERVMANDSRPPGFDKYISMNYIVTNDQYLTVTDDRMQKLAKIYRQSFKRNSKLPR